jgi:hypothetical protein
VTALLRWATAGCVGAVALALVLVVVQPDTVAKVETRASLERSGVRVVEPASTSAGAFDDVGESLRLAAGALVFGLLAGVALGATVDRLGRLPLVALGGFAISVAVLALADRATWRHVGAQAAFWTVAAGWLWWSSRQRPAVSGGSHPPR